MWSRHGDIVELGEHYVICDVCSGYEHNYDIGLFVYTVRSIFICVFSETEKTPFSKIILLSGFLLGKKTNKDIYSL